MIWHGNKVHDQGTKNKYSGSAPDFDVPPALIDATDPLSSLFVHDGEDMDRDNVETESLSEDSDSDENSDDEDIFQMRAAQTDSLCAEYKTMWLFQWQVAASKLAPELREDFSCHYTHRATTIRKYGRTCRWVLCSRPGIAHFLDVLLPRHVLQQTSVRSTMSGSTYGGAGLTNTFYAT